MKNYISINNKRIELPDDIVEKIIAAQATSCTKLSDVPVGNTVKIGGHEMIILEHFEDGSTALIRKDLMDGDLVFGEDNNNYDGSCVDEICNSFAEDIAGTVGEENVLSHTVDLTSDDGLKDYGTVERRASLITADMYRRYVAVLDKFKPDRWWWLATAFSTAKHDNDVWVKCVSPSGCIRQQPLLHHGDGGVRPFCILKSTIFVSG